MNDPEANWELLASIGLKAQLSIQQLHNTREYIEGRLDPYDFYGSPEFELLFNHFLDHDKMPYGIAKARDGEPDMWILDYFTD